MPESETFVRFFLALTVVKLDYNHFLVCFLVVLEITDFSFHFIFWCINICSVCSNYFVFFTFDLIIFVVNVNFLSKHLCYLKGFNLYFFVLILLYL